MLYRDRSTAARLIAEKFKATTPPDSLVLAIPRSGFIVGRELAHVLGVDLDVMFVDRIYSVGRYRDLLGAATEFGQVCSDTTSPRIGVTQSELLRLATKKIEELQKQRSQLTPLRSMRSPRGRDVILVDDGIITGATVLAAVQCLRACRPKRITVVTAVAPRSLRERMRSATDSYIPLNEVSELNSVSAYFESGKETISDDEMRTALGIFSTTLATASSHSIQLLR